MSDNDTNGTPGLSRVIRRLAAGSESTFARVRNLRERTRGAIQEKRDSLDAGDAVPSDKRPI